MIRFELTRAVMPKTGVSTVGDIITVDGQSYDFSALPEGAELPLGAVDCGLINGPVRREGGMLIVPLIAPCAGGHLPQEMWHPDPIDVAEDGPVTLPVYETDQERKA